MYHASFSEHEYCVSGLEGWSFNEALRLWKAKFESPAHFRRDVITHAALSELGDFVVEVWSDIDPVTVAEALGESNLEKRRVMFDCIGISRLFTELKPKLLDRQVINKKRVRWDEQNNPYEHFFEDTYELYELDGLQLFSVNRPFSVASVYAVRCWCTTTGREYWIYVPEGPALGRAHSWSRDNNPDAIGAIAWTIRIDITNPRRIFRQGDIIVVEESDDSQEVLPYHLNKEQYLTLMYSET